MYVLMKYYRVLNTSYLCLFLYPNTTLTVVKDVNKGSDCVGQVWR